MLDALGCCNANLSIVQVEQIEVDWRSDFYQTQAIVCWSDRLRDIFLLNAESQGLVKKILIGKSEVFDAEASSFMCVVHVLIKNGFWRVIRKKSWKFKPHKIFIRSLQTTSWNFDPKSRNNLLILIQIYTYPQFSTCG